MAALESYDFEANIHLYKWKELNILLDVNSGAIHLLDEAAFRLVEKIINYRGDKDKAVAELAQDFSQDEVTQLMQELEDAMMDEALFTEFDIPQFDMSGLQVKAICLNVAHACNMKCNYCFASQGDFGMKPALMPLETAKKALDFLLDRSGERKSLEVDFFGGEPLLVFPMLKELVSFARLRETETGKRFNFTLTTNAVLLDDEVTEFVIVNDISVIMSLDGRRATHDRHRILNNGEGSYDLVLPAIQKMVAKQPASYYVRGTFTRDNLDFTEDLRHMADAGFDCISLEPAVGTDNFGIKHDDMSRVLAEYERMTDLLEEYQKYGKEIHFFHYNLDLQKGPCLAKRVSGCGAGIEYLVITPEGDIYPCHQFVGEDSFYMGNIFDGEINQGIRQIFEENQLNNKECIRCWARYFCGGGCHAGAYFNGDIKKPHEVSCIMHKKRIEGAIYLDLVKKATNY